MKISVVICSIGRKSLKQTVLSLEKNIVKPSEIIIIFLQKKIILPRLHSIKVRTYYLDSQSLSVARNLGTRRAKGEIIAFTDDDCVVDTKWIYNIELVAQTHPHSLGFFGATLSYKPTELGKGICPCTFEPRKTVIIDEPCYHAEYVGYGNNMVFRARAFLRYGYFKEWLGAGSIGKSAEDAEFALRLLINNEKIVSHPNMIVYHNRWVSVEDYEQVLLGYLQGEFSCYGYYMFLGYSFAGRVLALSMKNNFQLLRRATKLLLSFDTEAYKAIGSLLRVLIVEIRGLYIAGKHALFT